MAGTKKNEYISLYRHAMLDVYQNDGASTKDANAMYREHSRELDIAHMTSDEIRDMTADRVVNTESLQWESITEGYMRDSNNPDMARQVVDSVYDVANQLAYEGAISGNWSTQNDQFLNDSQRDEIALKEQQEAEERADARYEAEDSYENVYEAEPAPAEPTWSIQMSKKGEPYVNATMDFDGEKKDIHFKKTFGNHELQDDEISKLLKGESINIESRSGNPLSVKVDKIKYMGREGYGLVRDDIEPTATRRTPEVSEAVKETEAQLG